MIRRADYTVADEMGTPEPGVYITVRDATGDLTALFNDDGTTLTNPFQSGTGGAFVYNVTDDGQYTEEYRLSLSDSPRKILTITLSTSGLDGLFVNASTLEVPIGTDIVATTGFLRLDKGSGVYRADAAVDSAYVAANPLSSFISANARGFRLSTEQEITPQMFGALADGVTDDSAAFVAALAYLKANASTGYGYGIIGGARLFVPKGIYFLGSTTLDLDFGIILEGESVGLLGPGSSVLLWSAGVTGIRTQAGNTTGATGVKTPVSNGGYATIKNLILQGTYSGIESEAHGIHARQTICVEDVAIYNFAGDGFFMQAAAGSGAPYEGNANSSFFKRVFVQGCRNGFFADGADVNAGAFIACFAISNRRWGFWDSSFLANLYLSCNSQGNGSVVGAAPCWVSHSGNVYCVKADQAVGASTNAPSGTTADNAYWFYHHAGGVDLTLNCPAWVSGMTLRDGGSFRTDPNDATINLDGCYHEGDQPLAQLSAPALVIGGAMRPNVRGVPTTYTGNDQFVIDGGLTYTSNTQAFGSQHDFGAQSGAVLDTNFSLNSTNTQSFNFYERDSGGAIVHTNGSITGSANNLLIGAGSLLRFYAANVESARISTGGIDLLTGKVLTVDGNQVVSARDTGWTADTGTARKAANATYAAGTTLTYSAAYVQAELTATATRLAAVEAALQNATQTIKALKDAAIAHGLIGA